MPVEEFFIQAERRFPSTVEFLCDADAFWEELTTVGEHVTARSLNHIHARWATDDPANLDAVIQLVDRSGNSFIITSHLEGDWNALGLTFEILPNGTEAALDLDRECESAFEDFLMVMRRIYFALYQQSQFISADVEATLQVPFTKPIVPYSGREGAPIHLFVRVYKAYQCKVPYDRMMEIISDRHQIVLSTMDKIKLCWDGHPDTLLVNFNLRHNHKPYSLLIMPEREDNSFYVEIADSAGHRIGIDEILVAAPHDEFAEDLGGTHSPFRLTADDFASIGPMFYVLMKDLEEA